MRKLYSFLLLIGVLMAQHLAAHPDLGGFSPLRDTLPSDSLRPDIIRFTPTTATQGSTISVFGTRFTGTTAVSFGGVSADSFTVFNDTLIRAVVGSGSSGAVRVTTFFGTDTLGGFSFLSLPPPPRIHSFTPASGRTGDTIRIAGTNFRQAGLVTFGGVRAPFIRVLSDSLIFAVVGNGASGLVTVSGPSGQGSAGPFTYIGTALPPDIVGFSPGSGSTGTMVSIVGRRLLDVNRVTFGGVPAPQFTILNDSLIRARVGNGASGAVVVRNAAGSDSLPGFVYFANNIPPTINSFSPASGRRNTFVNIVGDHFNSTTSVTFGGVPALTFTVVTDSLIRAQVGNGASGQVRVTTAAGADTACCFTFINDSLRPDITRFTPTIGGTGTRVSIFGRNFFNTTSVSFGGVPVLSYTVNGDSVINAFVGNGASGLLQVTTTAGSDTACCFTYVADTIVAKPVITVFYPNSARKGQTVEISGKHFAGATAVSFGGVAAASYSVITDTLIYAVVGNGASGLIRVANAFGFDTACCFTYIKDTIPSDSSKPIITFFSPHSARKGQKVEISGRHFTGATAVSFGGIAASTYSVITDTLIYATVGNGASGLVRVANGFGFDTVCCFTYIPAPDSSKPIITFFSPNSARKGQKVEISGKYFTGATAVTFGNVPASSYQVITDTLIYATVGNGASGLVRVANAFGFDTACCFTYIPTPDSLAPIIKNFSPTAARSGAVVSIRGLHFTGTTQVSFQSVPALTYTVVSDSLIRATVWFGESGSIRVSTPFGHDTACCFTYLSDTIPADSTWPNIISFNPTVGTAGTTVTIFGTNLTGVNRVTFGRVPARSFSVLSDSIISAIVDTGRTGLVEVRKPFGGRDSLGTFTYVSTDTLYTIHVAPNPARNTTIVTHPSIGSASQLQLSDVSGHVLRTVRIAPRVTQTRLNLTGVHPGLYKIGWTNGRKWFSQTILIQ